MNSSVLVRSKSAPVIDTLELARGVIAAFTYSGAETQREIHTSRVSAQFSQLGVGEHCADALSTLLMLGEIEGLGHGYWISTPVRRISLSQGKALVIGVHPTTELQRHFPSIRRVGAARIAEEGEVQGLAAQPFGSWVNSDGLSATEWVKAQFENARRHLRPSPFPEELELFAVKAVRGVPGRKSSDDFVPQWLKEFRRQNEIGLYRERLGARSRYFLGQFSRQENFLEGPIVRDSYRLQYGLAALWGKAFSAHVETHGTALALTFPLRLPFSLYRLLIAVGAPSPINSLQWRLREQTCWPTVASEIAKLNCEIFHHE